MMGTVRLHLTNDEVFEFRDDRSLHELATHCAEVMEAGGAFVVARSNGAAIPTTRASAEFGAWMSGGRRARGWTQAELAKRMGRSVSWVSQVERGTRAVDRLSVMDQLARVLDPEDDPPPSERHKDVLVVIPASSVRFADVSD